MRSISIALLTLLTPIFGMSMALAQINILSTQKDDNTEPEPATQILSDTLVYDDAKKTSRFTGDVVATGWVMSYEPSSGKCSMYWPTKRLIGKPASLVRTTVKFLDQLSGSWVFLAAASITTARLVCSAATQVPITSATKITTDMMVGKRSFTGRASLNSTGQTHARL